MKHFFIHELKLINVTKCNIIHTCILDGEYKQC